MFITALVCQAFLILHNTTLNKTLLYINFKITSLYIVCKYIKHLFVFNEKCCENTRFNAIMIIIRLCWLDLFYINCYYLATVFKKKLRFIAYEQTYIISPHTFYYLSLSPYYYDFMCFFHTLDMTSLLAIMVVAKLVKLYWTIQFVYTVEWHYNLTASV